MTSPPTDDTPLSPEPQPGSDSSFQNALNQAVQSFMEREFVPALVGLRDHIDVRVAEISKGIPTEEQIVSRVIGTLQAQAQAQMDQAQAAQAAVLRERIAQAASQNGHSATTGNLPAPQAASLAAQGGDDFKGKALAVLEIVNALFDKGFDKWMAFQNLKLAQTNPIAMAKHMAATDPVSARFIGMMLSGDPWQAQIPGMMANTADATSRAIVAGLLRSGWSPPGGVTAVAPAPGAAPPLVAPAPGSAINPVNPGSWPSPTPNLTGSPSVVPSGLAPSPSATTPSVPPSSNAVMGKPIDSIWATMR